MVFVCLGFLAVVATVYNLWRTGAAAVDSSEDMADSTWAKPAGALGELEREKRTLLKAIKEAEFDHQMGKLSQRDADEMIRGYRARAIEVIKQIDQLGLGAAGSVREQILREVRARIQLEGKSSRKGGAKAGAKAHPVTNPITAERRWKCPKCAAVLEKAGLGIVMIPGESAEVLKGNGTCSKCGASFTQASIYGGAFDVRPDAEANAKGEAGGKRAEPPAAEAASEQPAPAAEAAEAGAGATSPAQGAEGATTQAAKAVQVPSDDELDADSTTAIEPRHEEPAKEATP
jgi:hypothetical protein